MKRVNQRVGQRLNQDGAMNVLLIPLILLVVFFIGAASFAVWAYSGRQDYKNNVDQKISAANAEAVKAEDAKKDAQFTEDYKKPLTIYNGPAAFGSLKLSYPKTWSGYVDETPNGSTDLDGYFYPGVVPDILSQNSSFALRVQVVNQSYSNVLQNFSTYISSKKLSSAAYSLPKVSGIVGTRLDGEIAQNKQGSMVVLPLRDKTVKIWTEASQFADDFNNTILPNLTFAP